MKKFLLFVIALVSINVADAQFSRYIIKFKNKATNPFSIASPSAYLSTRAINKRTAYNIAIDSIDLPITPRYIDSVRLAGSVAILNKSKWLNQISIQTTDAAAITKITNLPFVESVSSIAARSMSQVNTLPKDKFELEKNITSLPTTERTTSTQNFFNYGTTFNEIKLHNGQFLHNIGLRGQGMLVAVLDAGFFNYTSLSSFDSMNVNNQVLQTWDFVAGNASVVEDDSHGMNCLSTIAGNIPGSFVGNAPKANFVLYRTEDPATEYPIEEHNWVSGLERADSTGVDIASTSLGYTTFDNATFDHTYSQMNGRTTIAAKGAVFANRKGMLLFAAAGNDGNNSWKYISTPADADSLVTVGAVTTSGTVGSFSSYGPSADGRVKPEVAAVGVNAYVQNANNTIGTGNGTSFACPKMAGLGTCLWQGFPEFNNIVVRDALIKSGSQFATPNDRIGYGIPDVKKAFVTLLNRYAKITSASITNCRTSINFITKDVNGMKLEFERMLPGQTAYTKIAEMQGTGLVLSNKSYTYLDTLTNAQPGIIKYRIKQIVDTATASFTATTFDSVNVNLSSACVTTAINPVTSANEKISILPNPANAQFTLRIETDYAVKNLVIRITDIKGSVVAQFNKSKTIGTANFQLPIANLSRGKYVVSVYNDKKLIENKALLKM